MDEVLGWFQRVAEELGSVSPWALLPAFALQTGVTALNALAWRNILAAAYPAGGVRFGPVFGAYAGGVGLNQVLPAQAGTIAMLGLYRGMIRGATVPGVLGAQVVQTLFFFVAGSGVYLLLFLSVPGADQVHFSLLLDHPAETVAIAAAVAAALVVLGRILRRRLARALRDAREGATILGSPGRYAAGVLAPQIGAYALRLGVLAVLMWAYDVPVTIRNTLLMLAVESVSTTIAVTPGGAGTQQALAAVALRDAAPSATVTAYSLGQQIVVTVWNVAFGIAALTLTIGWGATRGLIRERWEAARHGSGTGAPDDPRRG